MKNEFINDQDHSLILRYTKDLFFTPLVHRLPTTLKPNTITLFGFFCVLLCSFCTFCSNRTFKAGYLLSGLALIVYMVADNIDGMHARNTNQTSRLGGFLDQWLDACSFLIITMALMSGLHVSGMMYIFVMILMALMNFVLFYEQHQYGSFYKPAFGPNEFLVLVSILYFLLFIFYKSPNFVFQKTTFNNASVITYTTLTVSILYFLRAFVSIKISFRNFIFPILVHLIILIPFYFNRSLSPVIAGTIIIAVNSVFIGKILLTVYSFSAVPRNFFSRLFISPSLLESVITNPEEEIKTERKDTPL